MADERRRCKHGGIFGQCNECIPERIVEPIQAKADEVWTTAVTQFQEALQALDDAGQTAADAQAPDDLLDMMRSLLGRIRAASYGYAQDNFEHVSNRFQGNWNIISEEPNSDTLTYPELRPALAEFLAHSLISMAEPSSEQRAPVSAVPRR